jgi:2-dehydropantoate 2-reductase
LFHPVLYFCTEYKESGTVRIVVMGTGGLGGYFGGLLARSGSEVNFIARGAHLQVLQNRGLTVRSMHGDFVIPVQASETPEESVPADLVLFCVKTYAVEAAAALLQSVVADHPVLLTLQNGVDTPSQLQEVFGRGLALAGVTRMGSTLAEPGVIVQQTSDRTIEFGALDHQGQGVVERVRAVLEAAGIPVVVADDIRRILWEKLVFISAFSGLSALTGLLPKQLLSHHPTRQLYCDAMQETAAVGQAAGVAIAPDIVAHTLTYLDAQDDLGESSMAVDLQRGRPIEVEAINGAVVRHGQRLQVPTPVNSTIYASLIVMDQVHRRVSPTLPHQAS